MITEMKNNKLIVFGVGILALVACTKKPKACLEVEYNTEVIGDTPNWVVGTTCTLGQTFNFRPFCSEHLYKNVWDFGDGTGSGEKVSGAYTHSYKNAGTYTVKMKALSKNEKKIDEVSIEVTVKPKSYTFNSCFKDYPYTDRKVGDTIVLGSCVMGGKVVHSWGMPAPAATLIRGGACENLIYFTIKSAGLHEFNYSYYVMQNPVLDCDNINLSDTLGRSPIGTILFNITN